MVQVIQVRVGVQVARSWRRHSAEAAVVRGTVAPVGDPGEGRRAVGIYVLTVVVPELQQSSRCLLVNVLRVRLTQVLVLLPGTTRHGSEILHTTEIRGMQDGTNLKIYQN